MLCEDIVNFISGSSIIKKSKKPPQSGV
jgi:hypothetical protein